MSLRPVILPKLNKDGKTNIKIRLTHKRMTRELATDFYIQPSEWNEKMLKVNSKHNNDEFINFELKKLILDYEKKLLGKDVSAWHISRLVDFLKEECNQ